MDQIYVYRGVDDKRRPVNGKFMAPSADEADKLAKDFCSVVEAVYLDSKQPTEQQIKDYREAVQNANTPPVNAGPGPTGPLVTEAASVPQTPDVAPSGMRSGPVTGLPPQSKIAGELPNPKVRAVHEMKPIAKQLTDGIGNINELENPPSKLDNTYRESLLVGEWKSIQNQLEVLLDRQDGSIKAVEMVNDVSGKIILSVVIKHRRK